MQLPLKAVQKFLLTSVGAVQMLSGLLILFFFSNEKTVRLLKALC